MVLPINIDVLLGNSVVESNRIEYKAGWNPDSIYRTICAFANDFDDTCGGYIVVGVEEKDGRPVRPVKGIDISQIDRIGKEMVGFNNLITPYYQPRTFFEQVDGKTILVIWAAAGERRPYKVPDQVTAKDKKYSYYIRYNSSTIVAKDEYFNELMELANKAPFDDRGNVRAEMKDVSMLLIRDYLEETGSKMVDQLDDLSREQVLSQMNLLEGPKEQSRVKNVALMMFSFTPEKFFPGTQIDIVLYPKGKVEDPNNFIEVPPFKGPVHITLRKALDYIRNMIILKGIHKPKDDAHSIITYNYPYQALEEALVNAYYHRRYDEYQPVEVNVLPDRIEIISYGGAERSIKLADLNSGKMIFTRRYRNPRLGDFLKELGLTEGRGTGLPTIHDELKRNGSPDAIIDADEEHTYFMITIPCHPDFVTTELQTNMEVNLIHGRRSKRHGIENGIENGAKIADGIENGIENSDKTTDGIENGIENGAKTADGIENGIENSDKTTDGIENGIENRAGLSSNARKTEILRLMKMLPQITVKELANELSSSPRTISRDISFMINQGILRREGGDKGGTWIAKEE
jgi:ATP-dependent DNA helicase RecG